MYLQRPWPKAQPCPQPAHGVPQAFVRAGHSSGLCGRLQTPGSVPAAGSASRSVDASSRTYTAYAPHATRPFWAAPATSSSRRHVQTDAKTPEPVAGQTFTDVLRERTEAASARVKTFVIVTHPYGLKMVASGLASGEGRAPHSACGVCYPWPTS